MNKKELEKEVYSCRTCGVHPHNRQTWCGAGCGRDYNEMTKIKGINKHYLPLKEVMEAIEDGMADADVFLPNKLWLETYPDKTISELLQMVHNEGLQDLKDKLTNL